MKFAQIVVLDESGFEVWDGSLRQFARDNAMGAAEVAALVAELRVEQAPASFGGGAGHQFLVCLVA